MWRGSVKPSGFKTIFYLQGTETTQPNPYLQGFLHLLLRYPLQIRWQTWFLSSSSRVFMYSVPAVDVGSVIWSLISRNKGSLQSMFSVRENWVKCLLSIETIVQGCFHFNNQTLNFWHLKKDICHIWVWYDPDWNWSGGNDHKGRKIYQFNLHLSIHISESHIPIQKTCLFLLCS